MMGWVAVAVVVVAYDAQAVVRKHPTMSTVARRHPLVSAVGIAALWAHLFADQRSLRG